MIWLIWGAERESIGNNDEFTMLLSWAQRMYPQWIFLPHQRQESISAAHSHDEQQSQHDLINLLIGNACDYFIGSWSSSSGRTVLRMMCECVLEL
jgi:hypothetical protein